MGKKNNDATELRRLQAELQSILRGAGAGGSGRQRGEIMDSADSAESELFGNRKLGFDEALKTLSAGSVNTLAETLRASSVAQLNYDIAQTRAQERRHTEDQHQQRLRQLEEVFRGRQLDAGAFSYNLHDTTINEAAANSLLLGTSSTGVGHLLSVGVSELAQLGLNQVQLFAAVDVLLRILMLLPNIPVREATDTGGGSRGGGGGGGRSRAKRKAPARRNRR